MFKKMLAAVGIGGAKVDAVLESSEVVLGDTIRGVVKINGGAIGASVTKAFIEFATKFSYTVEVEVDTDNGRQTQKQSRLFSSEYGRTLIGQNIEMGAKGDLEIPFEITLPLHAPVTPIGLSKALPLALESQLDVPFAIDPRDSDQVIARPHPDMQAAFDFLAAEGYHLREVELKLCSTAMSPVKFVQEFEFKASMPGMRFDEVELMFLPRGDTWSIIVEADIRARGLRGFFAEVLDLDESVRRVTAPIGNPEAVVAAIRVALEEASMRGAVNGI